MNGNADNKNLLIAVTHWVERSDFDQIISLVLFNLNMPKSMTAPLETAFTLHHMAPRLFQLPVIIAWNFTCSKIILSGDLYCGNAGDPPALVKPPSDTKILILPSWILSPPAHGGFWKKKQHLSLTQKNTWAFLQRSCRGILLLGCLLVFTL